MTGTDNECDVLKLVQRWAAAERLAEAELLGGLLAGGRSPGWGPSASSWPGTSGWSASRRKSAGTTPPALTPQHQARRRPMSDSRTSTGHRGDGNAASTLATGRWIGLSVMSVAQLMVALDVTIMNIALPSAQRGLHLPDADPAVGDQRLRPGPGRAAARRPDRRLPGPEAAFLIGVVGFAAGSALGAAVSLPMLVAGRAVQDAVAAILIPTALSLLAVTFTEPNQRARAFAVYGAIGVSGGARAAARRRAHRVRLVALVHGNQRRDRRAGRRGRPGLRARHGGGGPASVRRAGRAAGHRRAPYRRRTPWRRQSVSCRTG